MCLLFRCFVCYVEHNRTQPKKKHKQTKSGQRKQRRFEQLKISRLQASGFKVSKVAKFVWIPDFKLQVLKLVFANFRFQGFSRSLRTLFSGCVYFSSSHFTSCLPFCLLFTCFKRHRFWPVLNGSRVFGVPSVRAGLGLCVLELFGSQIWTGFLLVVFFFVLKIWTFPDFRLQGFRTSGFRTSGFCRNWRLCAVSRFF